LQEPTYKKYKAVWKQLLCFVYRRVWQQQGPALHYVLTSGQSAALSSIMQAAVEIYQQEQQEQGGGSSVEGSYYGKLDEACLLFCITLLDHALLGNIYDSVIVGFLVVLGINNQGAYHDPPTYTSNLSAFVKIAQLLVV
jgi:hypothetical protein